MISFANLGDIPFPGRIALLSQDLMTDPFVKSFIKYSERRCLRDPSSYVDRWKPALPRELQASLQSDTNVFNRLLVLSLS